MKTLYLRILLLSLLFCLTQIIPAQEETPETEDTSIEAEVVEDEAPNETVTTETDKPHEETPDAATEPDPIEAAVNEDKVSSDSTNEYPEPAQEEIADADTSDSLTETAVTEPETAEETRADQSGETKDQFTLSGRVTDNESGDTLAGVTVRVFGTSIDTLTDKKGMYSLTLPKVPGKVVYTIKGYTTVTKEITVTSDTSFNIKMEPTFKKLSKELVVSEKKNENITSTEMSVEKFEIEEIETVPVIMGEKDIMKTIQLTPGITVITEGEIGFVVRGSGIDENLVLMDGMPLYYSSHQQGLYSVFNSDAVDNFKIYKGGIPASYGGRASSIMDVRMKGDKVEEFHTKLTLGLITSKFSLETPIVKDKLSIFGAGRFTKLSVGYIHDQIKGGNELSWDKGRDSRQKDDDRDDGKNGIDDFYFFDPNENWLDMNGKIVYNINDNNRVDLSGYFGRDSAITAGGFTEWGNRAAVLRWNHDFSSKFLSNTALTYSRYYTSAETGIYRFYSGIKIGNFKQEFGLFPNKNNDIRFGLSTEYQKYDHGALEDETQDDAGKFMPPMQALESALYVGNDQNIGEKLAAYYGLRYSFFFQMGSGHNYTYDDVSNEVISSEYFPARNNIMHVYHMPEPRLSLTYIFNEQNSVKFFYNRSAQYLRLMTLGMQLQWYDIWMPCTKNIEPLSVNQIALGYFGNFFDDQFQFSAETYYKWAKNAAAFEDGLHNYLVDNLEAYVATGKGRSYGLELMLKKPSGRLNGWLSYNLGRSEKKVDVINNGEWFPSMFDKTHDVTAVLCCELFRNLSLSATFIYSTGNAVTLPEAYYYISDIPFPYWEGRNKYRLPAYHRLDMGLKYELSVFKKLFNKYNRDLKISLELSGYNVYNRRNIVSMGYAQGGSGKTGSSTSGDVSFYEPYGISIYGFIPSFLLNVEF